MKKILSIILAALMFCAVFAPTSVLAENGPYPEDAMENINPDNLTDISDLKMSMIMIMDYDLSNDDISMGIVYPTVEGFVLPEKFKGMSYDLQTNTLTLKNVRAPEAFLTSLDMGDDFKIKLVGYNELGCILSMGQTRGAAITLTGNGELVLNKDDIAGGSIEIMGGETAAFLKIEKDVNLKANNSPEFEMPSIIVDGSSITDPAQLIKIDGTVKSGAVKSEPYTVEVFQQISGYDIEDNTTTVCDIALKKGEELFAGFDAYNDDYEFIGYYVFPVAYDEALGCYASEIIEKEEDFLVTDYASAGYTEIPANEVPVSFRNFFIPTYAGSYDMALSEDGTQKYGFFTYEDEVNGEEKATFAVVYKVIEHEKYGNIFQEISQDNLDGLVPQKIGEKNFVYAYIPETLVVNEGGTVAPATVKLSSAKPTVDGVKVTWTPLKNAEQYRVYRKAAGEKSWKALTTLTGAEKSSYTDKTAKSGVKYTYTVKAYNKVGWGGYNKTGVSLYYIDNPTPTLKNVNGGVKISWKKVSGAKSYTVYRKLPTDKSWTALKRDITGTSYTDKTAKSGKEYIYTVKAINGKNASAFGSYKITYLAQPKLNKSENTLNGVKVSWSKVPGATQYIVYMRDAKTGKWVRSGTTTKTYFVEKIGSSNVDAVHTVKAQKGSTYSAYNTKGVKIHHIKAPAFTVNNTAKGVQLKWSNVADATGFKIYRRVKGTTEWTPLVSQSKSKFKKSGSLYVYTDTKVKSGVTYEYAMRSLGKNCYSAADSEKVAFLTAPKLNKPINGARGITYTWKEVPGATWYIVYRKTGNGKWENIGGTVLPIYYDPYAQKGVKYTYTVRASNGDYQSTYDAKGVQNKCDKSDIMVFRTKKGDCYHYSYPASGSKGYYAVTLTSAKKAGLKPCKSCVY